MDTVDDIDHLYTTLVLSSDAVIIEEPIPFAHLLFVPVTPL